MTEFPQPSEPMPGIGGDAAGRTSPLLHDISVAIGPRMPSWPGDPTFESKLVDAIAEGEAANVSWIGMGAHCGTHVDAPLHFFQDGATVDSLPLDVLVGPCIVAELPIAGAIRAADLAALSPPAGVTRLLLKSPNSSLWHSGDSTFRADFVGLAPDAAVWVVQRGIRLLGVDYLSVEPYPAPHEHPVHRTLLAAGVVILEGTDLSRVAPGAYLLVCLPLKLIGLEGAPARAILIECPPGPARGPATGPVGAFMPSIACES
jgi:arylformamidase